LFVDVFWRVYLFSDLKLECPEMTESGRLIRQLREDRFLKPSDIERQSRSIADSKGNEQYYIAHATLADIEAGADTAIYKIFSLAVIFKIPLTQLLLAFGIDARETEQLTEGAAPKETALEPIDLTEIDVSFRLNFDNRINPRETNLLPGKPEEWGMAPTALVKRLQPRRFTYALVGLDDDIISAIIPSRSLIEFDREQNEVQSFFWRTLRQRPIYLVWHDDGYTCGWCDQGRNELLVVPHPVSRRSILRLKLREATIIGRIVHAWCSFQTPSIAAC